MLAARAGPGRVGSDRGEFAHKPNRKAISQQRRFVNDPHFSRKRSCATPHCDFVSAKQLCLRTQCAIGQLGNRTHTHTHLFTFTFTHTHTHTNTHIRTASKEPFANSARHDSYMHLINQILYSVRQQHIPMLRMPPPNNAPMQQ